MLKIPGLAHVVEVKMDAGVNKVVLSLRGDVIASTPVRSRSESGIMKSIIEVAKMAEIAHQIPESIFSDLANKLTSESGYLDPVITKDSSGTGVAVQPVFDPEVDAKLTEILKNMQKMENRLENLQENLGKLGPIEKSLEKLEEINQKLDKLDQIQEHLAKSTTSSPDHSDAPSE